MKLSNQEVLNKVVSALRKQGCKSELVVNENGCSWKSCRYRGENGTKCAAGHLIPDELYNESMEGNTVDGLPYFTNLVEDINFLLKLQSIHDNDPIDEWETEWRDLAISHILQMP